MQGDLEVKMRRRRAPKCTKILDLGSGPRNPPLVNENLEEKEGGFVEAEKEKMLLNTLPGTRVLYVYLSTVNPTR